MSIRFSKKEWIAIGTALVLMIGLIFSAVWFFYLPVKNQRENVQNDINTEKKLIEALDGKIASIKQDSFENSSSLQQKVPVKPMTQQLLIDLEKAEIVSDSFIKSMAFSEGSVTLPMTEGSALPAEGEVAEGEGVEGNPPPGDMLPPGIQKLTATLAIEAKSYFEIEKFIQELEELHRIVEVEQISFSGPAEILQYKEDVENIQLNLVVSAFYLPGLVELESELPKLDTPLPSNKKNPFQQFPQQNSENVKIN
ncbi:hypothetical protein [Bacillus sp. KH172YL63]|uniref:hypothetical protein n=1 Tax=Bacillus sp. KH172YL63 TaxID=2709784 RepID=UPI0013E487F8|nr:hypothetical protein [Bacillus sp. KH172YL63]BCB04999.1 hypothetical protein KH172YL63_31320 [Bacillus sp. KH172YL63]